MFAILKLNRLECSTQHRCAMLLVDIRVDCDESVRFNREKEVERRNDTHFVQPVPRNSLLRAR